MRTITANAKPDDLFIVVSLSGETDHVVEFAERLHTRSIPLISVTRLKSNTLSRLATESLYVTVCKLPYAYAEQRDYESMMGFFLLVEVWFLSYSQFLAEQE